MAYSILFKGARMTFSREAAGEVMAMKSIPLFRAILSGVIGLVIGVIFTALVKLIVPSTNLAWTLFPICLAAIISGFAGYIMGAKQKK
jgi:hypothetical protein